MSDAVNKPAHYNQGSIECIDAMQIVLTPEEFRGYLKGNVFKYLWREKDKNGIEDLRKAKWYLDRLIEHCDESLIDLNKGLVAAWTCDNGKAKQVYPEPKWTPKVGDWVRIKKPADTQSSACSWWPSMDKYDGQIVQVSEIDEDVLIHGDGWGFLFDWLEPAEQPVVKKSLTTEPPDGWRPNDNVSLAMQMAANSFGGKDGVFNGANFSNAMRQLAGVTCNLDGYVVATILGGRSDVEVLKGGSHYRYLFYKLINSSKEAVEPPKQQTPTDPPEGYRWLEVGEVIRKGDQCFTNHSGWIDCLTSLGQKFNHEAHYPTIRRNRFEVGEKVVAKDSHEIWEVDSLVNGIYQLRKVQTFFGSYPEHLAPYIEETT